MCITNHGLIFPGRKLRLGGEKPRSWPGWKGVRTGLETHPPPSRPALSEQGPSLGVSSGKKDLSFTRFLNIQLSWYSRRLKHSLLGSRRVPHVGRSTKSRAVVTQRRWAWEPGQSVLPSLALPAAVSAVLPISPMGPFRMQPPPLGSCAPHLSDAASWLSVPPAACLLVAAPY